MLLNVLDQPQLLNLDESNSFDLRQWEDEGQETYSPVREDTAEKNSSSSYSIFHSNGCWSRGMLRRDDGFDTVLVDEAGQLTGANTLVATGKATTRVVVVGDHQQLRTTVHEGSKKLGFAESLFGKLHKQGYPRVMVDTQIPNASIFNSISVHAILWWQDSQFRVSRATPAVACSSVGRATPRTLGPRDV